MKNPHQYNNWETETLKMIGYFEICSCCHDDFPIYKYDPYYERDNPKWIEYNGVQYLCNDCRN